jgi:hypothetical protein
VPLRITLLFAAILAFGVRIDAQDTAPAGQQPATDAASKRSSPWLLVPIVSSSPKLGTSGGVLAAYLKTFDPESRVSLFAITYQYTSTHSEVAGLFARTSFGADHHRLVALLGLGYIRNDYEDYLGTGQPLQTSDDLRAALVRYLYRLHGDWFVGGWGSATNYQMFGASAEDDLVLETLGLRGFVATGAGAVVMHDSRDSEDMPTRGWFANVNNLAYREALGGSASFNTYRADFRMFVPHGKRHVLAFRQNNWLTSDAPAIAQATVVLRGYKLGQYLAPYMSSAEVEERLSLASRWGVTVFAGVATLYGQRDLLTGEHSAYPNWGVGLHFVMKPAQRMIANLEYAQGIEQNRGIYLKFGYGW